MKTIRLQINGTFQRGGLVAVDKKISEHTMQVILTDMLMAEANEIAQKKKSSEERLYQKELQKQHIIEWNLFAKYLDTLPKPTSSEKCKCDKPNNILGKSTHRGYCPALNLSQPNVISKEEKCDWCIGNGQEKCTHLPPKGLSKEKEKVLIAEARQQGWDDREHFYKIEAYKQPDKATECGYCKRVQKTHNGNLAYNCKKHTKPSMTVTKVKMYTEEQLAEELDRETDEEAKFWQIKVDILKQENAQALDAYRGKLIKQIKKWKKLEPDGEYYYSIAETIITETK